jgi:hypothetical protein
MQFLSNIRKALQEAAVLILAKALNNQDNVGDLEAHFLGVQWLRL